MKPVNSAVLNISENISKENQIISPSATYTRYHTGTGWRRLKRKKQIFKEKKII
jgi:hypothetical protein